MADEKDPSYTPVYYVGGTERTRHHGDTSSDSTIPPLAPAEDCNTFDIVKATQFGVFDRCKEIIEGGYDVNRPDSENVTLLHWAAINNRQEIVRHYISKGAHVDTIGGELHSTPLHWATRQGHLAMVVLLMHYGADPAISDGEEPALPLLLLQAEKYCISFFQYVNLKEVLIIIAFNAKQAIILCV